MEQVGTGIVEAALMVIGEVFAAELDHLRVQIDHGSAFHRSVGQHLAEGAAFAAAPDENLLGSRMAEHGRMHQRLMVDMLVPFRGLSLAV